jgi:hypothetical protein
MPRKDWKKEPAVAVMATLDREFNTQIDQRLQQIRGTIVGASAFIEELIEDGLLKLLGIPHEVKNNFIRELSFDNHIKLLEDMQKKDVDVSAFKDFKAIRNEFTHGTEFSGYTEYYRRFSTQGQAALARIKRFEEQNELRVTGTDEEKYALSVQLLIIDVLKECRKVFLAHEDNVKTKLGNDAAYRIFQRTNIEANAAFQRVYIEVGESGKNQYTRKEVIEVILKIHDGLRADLHKITSDELEKIKDEFNLQQLKYPSDHRSTVSLKPTTSPASDTKKK